MDAHYTLKYTGKVLLSFRPIYVNLHPLFCIRDKIATIEMAPPAGPNLSYDLSMMKKILMGLVLTVMATAANAEWVLVSEGANGNKTYSDPATKKRTGDVVRMWGITDYAKPEFADGKSFQSTRYYSQNDCAERTSQALQLTAFVGRMGTGERHGGFNTPGNKSYVEPGTVAEKMLNFACK